MEGKIALNFQRVCLTKELEMQSILIFFSYFILTFQNKKKKKIEETNILYVTDQNMSFAFEDIPAVFLFVTQGGEKHDQFRARSEFISAGSALGSRCYFAVMDGERNPRFVRQVNLIHTRGYFFFRYGKLVDRYWGKMRADAFVQYAMSRTGCPFTTFDDYPTAQDFIESNPIGVVLYIPEAGGRTFDRYNQLATNLRDNFTFGLCPDIDLAEELDVTTFPTLILYRQKDKARLIYPDNFDTATFTDIILWVTYNSKPKIDLFQIQNQITYKKGKPVILFFLPVRDDEKEKSLQVIQPLAETYGEDLNFTQIDAVTGNRFMTSLGFSKYADPACVILVYNEKMSKYRYPEEGDFTFENISTFIISFLDHKLKPEIKNQELPENNTGPIIQLNSLTFEDEIIKPDKAALVLYYEPWDHIYGEFLSDYILMAEEFNNKSVNRIILSKINVAENDLIIGPDPKRTPVLYLFIRNQKKVPIMYNGILKKNQIIDFLDDEIGIKSEL